MRNPELSLHTFCKPPDNPRLRKPEIGCGYDSSSERSRVKQLHESLSRKQGHIFLSDVVNSISNDRAGIVLDCSRARLMDRPAIYLLLCCLEEAIKHDSDVKLAAIPRMQSDSETYRSRPSL